MASGASPLPADRTFLDPVTLADPFAFYREGQEFAPVHHEPMLGVYLVLRTEDIEAVLHDTQTFSSRLLTGGLSIQPPHDGVDAVLAEGWPHLDVLNFIDPPEHTRFRSLISGAFRPRRVQQLVPVVRQLAEGLVAGWKDGEPLDLMAGLAVPVPIETICAAIGVGPEQRHEFEKWSDALMARFGRPLTESEDVGYAAQFVELQQFIAQEIEKRREGEWDDLLFDLVHAEAEGYEPLSLNELISIVTVLIVAGNETTRLGIGSTVLLLLTHPELQARVRADRSLLDPLVEEALRLESPVQMVPRVTTRDVVLSGTTIPAGSRVLPVVGAANRDPGHVDRVDEVVLDRADIRGHLAFGRGPHFCAGHALARAEIRTTVDVLLDTFDDLAFAPGSPPPPFVMNILTRGPMELPVVVRRRS